MEHQTLGWWVICPSDPATQRIMLKIVGFQMQTVFATAALLTELLGPLTSPQLNKTGSLLGCFWKKYKYQSFSDTIFFYIRNWSTYICKMFYNTISRFNFLFLFLGKNLDFFPIDEMHQKLRLVFWLFRSRSTRCSIAKGYISICSGGLKNAS